LKTGEITAAQQELQDKTCALSRLQTAKGLYREDEELLALLATHLACSSAIDGQ